MTNSRVGDTLAAPQIVGECDTLSVEFPCAISSPRHGRRLAERIEQTRHVDEGDVERIDEMLQLVEQLSEAEIEALLARQEISGEE